VNTTLTLSADKQGLVCDGGRRNSCGSRNAPLRGHASPTWFLRYVSLDLDGHDNWYCPTAAAAGADGSGDGEGRRRHNAFTFIGSYYHVYAKLASCHAPTGQLCPLQECINIMSHSSVDWLQLQSHVAVDFSLCDYAGVHGLTCSRGSAKVRHMVRGPSITPSVFRSMFKSHDLSIVCSALQDYLLRNWTGPAYRLFCLFSFSIGSLTKIQLNTEQQLKTRKTQLLPSVMTKSKRWFRNNSSDSVDPNFVIKHWYRSVTDDRRSCDDDIRPNLLRNGTAKNDEHR